MLRRVNVCPTCGSANEEGFRRCHGVGVVPVLGRAYLGGMGRRKINARKAAKGDAAPVPAPPKPVAVRAGASKGARKGRKS
jgi:hypothetical protein